MLRFGPTANVTRRRGWRPQWRMWLLVIALGAVLGTIRSLQQPATVARLGVLFGEVEQRSKDSGAAPTESELDLAPLPAPAVTFAGNGLVSSRPRTLAPEVDLASIRDNTYFRSEENPAWFGILAALQASEPAELREAALGEVTYAQFVSQPAVYRGQVVSVRGTVKQEEKLTAPANEVGITDYHRLVLQPQGGGVWPIIVYALELPAGFVVSEKQPPEVLVDGVFFKNWSYAWEEGLGLAPVILAKTVTLGDSVLAPPVRVPSETQSNTDTKTSEPIPQGGFREVLQLAGLDQDKLATLDTDGDFTGDRWRVLIQLYARLRLYGDAELATWTSAETPDQLAAGTPGELYLVTGTVEQVKLLELPRDLAQRFELDRVYRVQLKTPSGETLTLLAETIPKRWDTAAPLAETVTCRAVLMPVPAGREALLVTTQFAWTSAALPLGQLLLSKHGMDAALWEAVAPRGRLVSPEKGREAEAFYSCLAALNQVPETELAQAIGKQLAEHSQSTPASGDQRQHDLAEAVAERARQGRSSVVPLFLEPEKHLGDLVRLEGTVRRAVRVMETEDSGLAPPRSDYYEVELFTADSRNLPVVGCVNHLPTGFPTGDQLREQVRLDGVFFKAWRYRSRKADLTSKQAGNLKPQFAPLVLAKGLTWVKLAPPTRGWWQPVGGIVFLVLLAWVWWGILRDQKRPRRS